MGCACPCWCIRSPGNMKIDLANDRIHEIQVTLYLPIYTGSIFVVQVSAKCQCHAAFWSGQNLLKDTCLASMPCEVSGGCNQHKFLQNMDLVPLKTGIRIPPRFWCFKVSLEVLMFAILQQHAAALL